MHPHGQFVSRTELGSGWWVSLLGWPAVSVAAVAFCLAVAYRSRAAAVVGCVFAAPFFLYLGLYPGFLLLSVPALILLCVLAWRIRESSAIVNLLLALPALLVLLRVGWAVLGQ